MGRLLVVGSLLGLDSVGDQWQRTRVREGLPPNPSAAWECPLAAGHQHHIYKTIHRRPNQINSRILITRAKK